MGHMVSKSCNLAQRDVQHEVEFCGVIGAASDRPVTEPWIDSLSIAAGSGRVLLADERGVCGVRRRAEGVEFGAEDADVLPSGWVS